MNPPPKILQINGIRLVVCVCVCVCWGVLCMVCGVSVCAPLYIVKEIEIQLSESFESMNLIRPKGRVKTISP